MKAPQTWTGSPAPLPPSRSPSLAHFDDPPRGGLLGDCIGLEPEHLALLEHKPSAYACMQWAMHHAMGQTIDRMKRHVSMLSLVTRHTMVTWWVVQLVAGGWGSPCHGAWHTGVADSLAHKEVGIGLPPLKRSPSEG